MTRMLMKHTVTDATRKAESESFSETRGRYYGK